MRVCVRASHAELRLTWHCIRTLTAAAAAAAGVVSSSEGGAGDKLAAGAGRAVGLALSLRERVMQLEKRNR
jgi:hypothetical protein